MKSHPSAHLLPFFLKRDVLFYCQLKLLQNSRVLFTSSMLNQQGESSHLYREGAGTSEVKLVGEVVHG